MRILFLLISFFFVVLSLSSQVLSPFCPPLEGPGSKIYANDTLLFQDFAQAPDGYWLFEPRSPMPDSAHVIVFIHGYGAINPMIYGKWLEHLTRKGNIVIFPRYQKNLFSPKTKKFVPNVAKAIADAIIELQTKPGHVKPILDNMSFIGHSYGGVIAANLAVHFKKYELPQPKAVMLCSPGSGPFKGGVLKTYEKMPENTSMLIMVSEDDKIVGDKLGKCIFKTAINTPCRNLIRQFGDNQLTTAGHNESYCLDERYDVGIINISAKRAKRKSKLDAIDYFGYWKLFDALMECTRTGQNCHYAFGDTPQQKYLGLNTEGKPIKQLEIMTPMEVLIKEGTTEMN